MYTFQFPYAGGTDWAHNNDTGNIIETENGWLRLWLYMHLLPGLN